MSDLDVASRAKEHGAQFSLRIVMEAKRAGIPVSLGFALVEQESGFQNVFGHDPTIFCGAGPVTKAKYLKYREKRGPSGRGGMQGVGPCQLTWYSFQDQADQLGGCWIARHNIRVAFQHLATLVRSNGLKAGVRAYNGSGVAAERYAASVLQRQRRWHEILK